MFVAPPWRSFSEIHVGVPPAPCRRLEPPLCPLQGAFGPLLCGGYVARAPLLGNLQSWKGGASYGAAPLLRGEPACCSGCGLGGGGGAWRPRLCAYQNADFGNCFMRCLGSNDRRVIVMRLCCLGSLLHLVPNDIRDPSGKSTNAYCPRPGLTFDKGPVCLRKAFLTRQSSFFWR